MNLEDAAKMAGRDNYEKLARLCIEGVGGLFDLYRYEMAFPFCEPPEVEGARWLLACLVNPKNREILDSLVEQSDARAKAAGVRVTGLVENAKGLIRKVSVRCECGAVLLLNPKDVEAT